LHEHKLVTRCKVYDANGNVFSALLGLLRLERKVSDRRDRCWRLGAHRTQFLDICHGIDLTAAGKVTRHAVRGERTDVAAWILRRADCSTEIHETLIEIVHIVDIRRHKSATDLPNQLGGALGLGRDGAQPSDDANDIAVNNRSGLAKNRRGNRAGRVRSDAGQLCKSRRGARNHSGAIIDNRLSASMQVCCAAIVSETLPHSEHVGVLGASKRVEWSASARPSAPSRATQSRCACLLRHDFTQQRVPKSLCLAESPRCAPSRATATRGRLARNQRTKSSANRYSTTQARSSACEVARMRTDSSLSTMTIDELRVVDAADSLKRGRRRVSARVAPWMRQRVAQWPFVVRAQLHAVADAVQRELAECAH
jgi:hypothetical protein